MDYRWLTNDELIREQEITDKRFATLRELVKAGRQDEAVLVSNREKQEALHEEAQTRLEAGRMTEEEFAKFLPF